MYYPHGGFDAIESALVRCVRAAGGEVHTNVPVRGILCEEDEDGTMRALGVRLHLNEEDSGANDAVAVEETAVSSASPSSATIKGVVACSQVTITLPLRSFQYINPHPHLCQPQVTTLVLTRYTNPHLPPSILARSRWCLE